ncbi:MAG: hypothetical protein WC718_04405 [Phycisphaerales bacterium]|jgi:hypothetical protein
MRNHALCFAPVLLLAACSAATKAPSTPPPAAASASTAPTAAPVFPESWRGHYAGQATLHVPQDKLKDFWMELSIEPLANASPLSYTWQIIYAESQADAADASSKTRQVREYKLVEADAGRGRFDIDEGDGLVIPCVYIGGELWSFFDVGGTSLAAVYRKAASGSIEVEIITHPSEPASVLPSTQAKGIRAWLPASMQQATLRRVSAEPGQK